MDVSPDGRRRRTRACRSRRSRRTIQRRCAAPSCSRLDASQSALTHATLGAPRSRTMIWASLLGSTAANSASPAVATMLLHPNHSTMFLHPNHSTMFLLPNHATMLHHPNHAPRQRGSERVAHLEPFAVVVVASVDALHRARWQRVRGPRERSMQRSTATNRTAPNRQRVRGTPGTICRCCWCQRRCVAPRQVAASA